MRRLEGRGGKRGTRAAVRADGRVERATGAPSPPEGPAADPARGEVTRPANCPFTNDGAICRRVCGGSGMDEREGMRALYDFLEEISSEY